MFAFFGALRSTRFFLALFSVFENAFFMTCTLFLGFTLARLALFEVGSCLPPDSRLSSGTLVAVYFCIIMFILLSSLLFLPAACSLSTAI